MWGDNVRVVLQRVSRASVTVRNTVTGKIGAGIVILLGIREEDTENDVRWMAEKCLNLRIFEDDTGKLNKSLLDIRGDILVISQFTLYGDCRKGRRPSFTEAASPDRAEMLYQSFVDRLRKLNLRVETGIFAAKMRVEIHNEGPVTMIIDSIGR
jgi:D-tyrosyl-tRNA(Tyr) deacylase